MQSIVKRAKRQTPGFFKKLRTVGLGLAGLSTSIMAAPIPVPQAATIAGYTLVAGLVASFVSQVAVTNEKK